LIDRYLSTHPEGQKAISEAFTKCVAALNEAETGKHPMLEESSIALLVEPKKEFKKMVTKKYGKKGPYRVAKQIKSFTQHTSDGFYNLEGSESIYPADWFQPVRNSAPFNYSPYLMAIIWGLLLFSGGYSLGILQYAYIFMLLPF
jgi:hypothetical protein